MIRRIVRGIITLLFGAAGLYFDNTLFKIVDLTRLSDTIGVTISLFWTYIFSFILFSFAGFFIAPVCKRFFLGLIRWL